jgi:hypothetical protein
MVDLRGYREIGKGVCGPKRGKTKRKKSRAVLTARLSFILFEAFELNGE